MPKYKLTYFKIRARAEVSRYLFCVAGVPYENVMIENEDWPKLKPNSPFGQLPMLEVDGKMLCQSHVIERYLARQFGLAGKTEWDMARADMVVECVEDFTRPLGQINAEKDEEKKKEKMTKYLEETVPASFEYFDRMLKNNGRNGQGYFAGDEMTYADICFYSGMETAVRFSGLDLSMAKWPALVELRQRVASHPKIIEWNETRPPSNF